MKSILLLCIVLSSLTLIHAFFHPQVSKKINRNLKKLIGIGIEKERENNDKDKPEKGNY